VAMAQTLRARFDAAGVVLKAFAPSAGA
jgi:hypothetical protein